MVKSAVSSILVVLGACHRSAEAGPHAIRPGELTSPSTMAAQPVAHVSVIEERRAAVASGRSRGADSASQP